MGVWGFRGLGVWGFRGVPAACLVHHCRTRHGMARARKVCLGFFVSTGTTGFRNGHLHARFRAASGAGGRVQCKPLPWAISLHLIQPQCNTPCPIDRYRKISQIPIGHVASMSKQQRAAKVKLQSHESAVLWEECLQQDLRPWWKVELQFPHRLVQANCQMLSKGRVGTQETGCLLDASGRAAFACDDYAGA